MVYLNLPISITMSAHQDGSDTGLNPGGTDEHNQARVELRPRKPRHATIRRKALTGALIVLTLSIFIGAVGKVMMRAAAKQSEWVNHSQKVLLRLSATLLHLVDSETGARGFALTGKETFLEPYRSEERRV